MQYYIILIFAMMIIGFVFYNKAKIIVREKIQLRNQRRKKRAMSDDIWADPESKANMVDAIRKGGGQFNVSEKLRKKWGNKKREQKLERILKNGK